MRLFWLENTYSVNAGTSFQPLFAICNQRGSQYYADLQRTIDISFGLSRVLENGINLLAFTSLFFLLA
jgi:hypothetical protein